MRLQKMGSPRYRSGFWPTLQPDGLELPMRWRKSRMIFVNSMSNLFHEDISLEYIVEVFKVIQKTPRHTYQVLTKIAGRRGVVSSGLLWPD